MPQTKPAGLRIAMWSGPRNISTAMMRAWGNRADTYVVDEPFYAFYLNETGVDHPGADEVIGAGETDGVWAKYWYAEVERSTSFVPYRERKIEVPESLHKVHTRGREIYEELYQHRLH